MGGSLFLFMSIRHLPGEGSIELIDETTRSDYFQKERRTGVMMFAIFGVGDDAPTAPRRRFTVEKLWTPLFWEEGREGTGEGFLTNSKMWFVIVGFGRWCWERDFSTAPAASLTSSSSPTLFTTNFLLFFTGYRHLYISKYQHPIPRPTLS